MYYLLVQPSFWTRDSRCTFYSQIGPFDLATSMNVEFGGEEHEAAMAKVVTACKKAGKVAAIFCMPSAASLSHVPVTNPSQA
ncbi:unnamed protein product [Mycena citricolor]|uniref:Uncharacterized protein n=1 Tax=Mycena citricolor TaxID=2018698 RepID=A0AAD2Q449_9AGAR|nr:unnamed protein product [Mycena citricolor]